MPHYFKEEKDPYETNYWYYPTINGDIGRSRGHRRLYLSGKLVRCGWGNVRPDLRRSVEQFVQHSIIDGLNSILEFSIVVVDQPFQDGFFTPQIAYVRS